MQNLLIATLLLVSTIATAQDIFHIKKNHNPKNELHYKANIVDCKLKVPAVIGYWVMGEEDGHLEDLTRNEGPIYKPRISYQNEVEADFSIGAMDRMGSKLPNKTIKVRMENCQPKSYLEINGVEIQLSNIYVQVKLISVDYMILYGTNPAGEKVSHKIDI